MVSGTLTIFLIVGGISDGRPNFSHSKPTWSGQGARGRAGPPAPHGLHVADIPHHTNHIREAGCPDDANHIREPDCPHHANHVGKPNRPRDPIGAQTASLMQERPPVPQGGASFYLWLFASVRRQAATTCATSGR